MSGLKGPAGPSLGHAPIPSPSCVAQGPETP